ncbi:MAG: ATP:cob(I)alamin adenosyltransferase [Bacteroidales bacterium]|nr:ATP:cob(I)alamin adenosyltransferase [Candidatus Physcousia equi]
MRHEGDRGTTSIHHATDRIEKDDIRIEANGALDELNATMELIRTLIPTDQQTRYERFDVLQRWLMIVQTYVMTPERYRDRLSVILPTGMAQYCECWIDELDPSLHAADYVMHNGAPSNKPENFHRSVLQAQLNLARTVTRRAERRLWSLNNEDPVPAEVLYFINRLSDLFLTLARTIDTK